MYDKQAGRRIYFYLCNDCGYMYAAVGIRDLCGIGKYSKNGSKKFPGCA